MHAAAPCRSVDLKGTAVPRRSTRCRTIPRQTDERDRHRGERPSNHAKAAEILAAHDPVIARLVAAAGLPRLRRPQPSNYATLVQAIVYQELAGAAAATIIAASSTALDGDVRPEAVLALSVETLRGAGLSAKVASLQDLASKVLDETVVTSRRADSPVRANQEIVRPPLGRARHSAGSRRRRCSSSSDSAASTSRPHGDLGVRRRLRPRLASPDAECPRTRAAR